MIKNLMILAALTWLSVSYAKSPVVREDMKDAEQFRVESHTEEVKRTVAGGKFKKRELPKDENVTSEEQSDSEVRYWQYSE